MKNKDKIAKKYQNEYEAENYITSRYTNSFFKREHEIQLKTINEYIKNNFLEIAPGVGRITRGIKKNINKGVLIEFSPQMIKRIKDIKRFSIIQEDFFNFTSRKKFDFCFCFRFIRHFKKEEREIIYNKINFLLNKDSLLIFDVVNKIWGQPSKLLNWIWGKEMVYDKHYSLKEIKKELSQYGFKIVNIVPIYKIYPLQRILYSSLKIIGEEFSQDLVSFLDRKINNLNFGTWEWIIVAKKM